MRGFVTGLVHGTLLCGAALAALSLAFPKAGGRGSAPVGAAASQRTGAGGVSHANVPAATPMLPMPAPTPSTLPTSALRAAAPSAASPQPAAPGKGLTKIPEVQPSSPAPDAPVSTASAQAEPAPQSAPPPSQGPVAATGGAAGPASTPQSSVSGATPQPAGGLSAARADRLPDPVGSEFRRSGDEPPTPPAPLSEAARPTGVPRHGVPTAENLPVPAAPLSPPAPAVLPAAPVGLPPGPASPAPVAAPAREAPIPVAPPGRVTVPTLDRLPERAGGTLREGLPAGVAAPQTGAAPALTSPGGGADAPGRQASAGAPAAVEPDRSRRPAPDLGLPGVPDAGPAPSQAAPGLSARIGTPAPPPAPQAEARPDLSDLTPQPH